MLAPTIEDRLQKVEHFLILIGHIGTGDSLDYIEELVHAIHEYARDAIDELHWVTRLPGIVANLPAPDDEQLPDFSSDPIAYRPEQEQEELEKMLYAAIIGMMKNRAEKAPRRTARKGAR